MTDPYYGEGTHPHCNPQDGHTCQSTSGLTCVEEGCNEPAGTHWGPYWCPDHDARRIDRISSQFADIMQEVRKS